MPFEAAWREKDEPSRPACRSGMHFSLLPSNDLSIVYGLTGLLLLITGVPLSSSDDSTATRAGPMFCAALGNALRVRLGQVKNTNGSVSVR